MEKHSLWPFSKYNLKVQVLKNISHSLDYLLTRLGKVHDISLLRMCSSLLIEISEQKLLSRSPFLYAHKNGVSVAIE